MNHLTSFTRFGGNSKEDADRGVPKASASIENMQQTLRPPKGPPWWPQQPPWKEKRGRRILKSSWICYCALLLTVLWDSVTVTSAIEGKTWIIFLRSPYLCLELLLAWLDIFSEKPERVSVAQNKNLDWKKQKVFSSAIVFCRDDYFLWWMNRKWYLTTNLLLFTSST